MSFKNISYSQEFKNSKIQSLKSKTGILNKKGLKF